MDCYHHVNLAVNRDVIYLQTHYMVTQGCNSPILATISSMASCMAIFISYGTASMASYEIVPLHDQLQTFLGIRTPR